VTVDSVPKIVLTMTQHPMNHATRLQATTYDCPSEYHAVFRFSAQFIAIVESAIEIRSVALGHQAFGGGLQCRHARR